MNSEELGTLTRLRNTLGSSTGAMNSEDAYYNGEQRLAAMGLSIPPEMQRLQVVVNWPRTFVDAIEHRQDVEGFRLAGQWKGDETLWDWWQYNNLDVDSSLAHLERLIHGRSYLCLGYNELDPSIPIITVESPRSMIAEVDPRTRKTSAALRVYEIDTQGRQGAVLYMPYATIYAEHDRGKWTETDRYKHGLDEVPVVVMLNRARVGDRLGRSEMTDVMGLTDAACRSLMNLQGAQELMAVPQRYILGADESLFQDENGDPVPTWQAYLANILAIPDGGGTDVKVGQFTAADLRNFTETLNAYAHHVSTVTGLPPHYLGITSANPASAEAIRSSESRLVKHVERKNRAAGGAWEEIMRLGVKLTGYGDPDKYRRLETMWRDPATPTIAEKYDAVQKAMGGQPIFDRETGLEELGFSPERIRVVMRRVEQDPVMKLLMMGEDDENEADSVQQETREPVGSSGESRTASDRPVRRSSTE